MIEFNVEIASETCHNVRWAAVLGELIVTAAVRLHKALLAS